MDDNSHLHTDRDSGASFKIPARLEVNVAQLLRELFTPLTSAALTQTDDPSSIQSDAYNHVRRFILSQATATLSGVFEDTQTRAHIHKHFERSDRATQRAMEELTALTVAQNMAATKVNHTRVPDARLAELAATTETQMRTAYAYLGIFVQKYRRGTPFAPAIRQAAHETPGMTATDIDTGVWQEHALSPSCPPSPHGRILRFPTRRL